MAKATRASYAVLIACTLTHFMNHIYTGALTPFLPYIQDELGLNWTEMGIVTSAAVVTMTSSHLVVGYLGDRGWRDVFIPASILLSSIIILVSSFATTFVFLAATMLLLGFGASGYHPSVFPALTEKFPNDARAKATGIQAMGGLVGMALIPFMGVSLYVLLGGWRQSLVAIAVMGFILLVPVIFLMRYSTKEAFVQKIEEDGSGDGADSWTLNFYLLVILMGLRGMSFRCTTLLMVPYLADAYGYDPILAGVYTTIMLIAGLVGEIVAAPLSDRVGRRVPFLIISTGAAWPLLWLLNMSLDEVTLLLVLIGIGFFFFLGVPPNTAFQTEVVPRHSRGLAFGLLFSIGAIPGSLSPIVFGWIGDVYGLQMSIMFLVITTGFATLIALLLRDVHRPEKPFQTAIHFDTIPGK